MKANFKNIIILILIVGIVIVSASFIMDKSKDEDKFVYSELVELFEEDLVRDFVVDEHGNMKLNALVVKTNEDGEPIFEIDENGNKKYTFETDDKNEPKVKEYNYAFRYDIQLDQIQSIIEEYKNKENYTPNLKVYDFEAPEETPWYLTYLPWIITGVAFIGLTIFLMRQTSANGGAGKMGGFAKSKAKVVVGDKNSVKFADVAGADEEKAELEEVVEFLKDPEKFVKLGARIP